MGDLFGLNLEPGFLGCNLARRGPARGKLKFIGINYMTLPDAHQRSELFILMSSA